MAVTDKNIHVWELVGYRMFLGDYLHMGGDRKGDKVLGFLPRFVVPKKQMDSSVIH